MSQSLQRTAQVVEFGVGIRVAADGLADGLADALADQLAVAIAKLGLRDGISPTGRQRFRYPEAMPDSATLISVHEYLQAGCKPACEYRDGVLTPKPMPTRKHSQAQFRINSLIDASAPGFEAGPELTLRLSAGRFLVPDIAVQQKDRIQDPYPTEPIHLCVEVLSPEDRLSAVIAKGEEYHAWGVPTVWIVDPERRLAWEFSRERGLREVPPGGSLNADPIKIALSDVFPAL